jgi:hypothetical protein
MTTAPASLVDRLRPLLGPRPLGEQLYVAALLESRAADRYREWAAATSDPARAAGFRACAEREDGIAARIRAGFDRVLRAPADLAVLLEAVQLEVEALFGGRTLEEQYAVQARAERGGEGFWRELAASETDAAGRAVLLDCAALEAASATYLEKLRGG